MRQLITFIFLILFSATSFAGVSMSGSWTQPTENVDGSQLHYSEIDGYKVYYTFGDKLEKSEVYIRVKAGNESINQEIDIPEGMTKGALKFAVSVVTIYGGESDLSNVVEQKFDYAVTPKQPKPPTNVKISVSCDAECTIELVK